MTTKCITTVEETRYQTSIDGSAIARVLKVYLFFLTLLAVVCRYSFIFWTYLRRYRHVVAIESLILCIIVYIFRERSLFVAGLGTEFPPLARKFSLQKEILAFSRKMQGNQIYKEMARKFDLREGN